MNGDTLIEALELPASSRVNQRVPKKLLLENGAPTTDDKRLINDGIEELLVGRGHGANPNRWWKPRTKNLPAPAGSGVSRNEDSDRAGGARTAESARS